jgi:hypothetical protein
MTYLFKSTSIKTLPLQTFERWVFRFVVISDIFDHDIFYMMYS